MIPVSKKYPHLKIIIEDVSAGIRDGANFWNTHFPRAVTTKHVTFQVCDIFREQPVKDAAVFHIRRVLHNWSDSYAKHILLALHHAATPKTKLIVAELLLHPTCADPMHDNSAEREGYQYKYAPEPLLANYGSTHEVAYMTDLTMMTLFNGQDRTLPAMKKLLNESGWHITHVFAKNERHLSHFLAERGSLQNSTKL
ncbi:hypothetical protein D9757_012694 [Collybiopsis confluens]|uniref:O-methyltransferase C-terminal domain-containing protein n=1 Tax=Collybiopsis confluens TaxID=2823264 RepID=A0A8H5GJB1_9AGAR|nr:hypothetical protein D9757_012694 [Collybiopsis confluens]